jgi:hypothetical protein
MRANTIRPYTIVAMIAVINNTGNITASMCLRRDDHCGRNFPLFIAIEGHGE